MADLGLNAYRFSISWSRILPEGRGRVNAKGLDFYERLVDALLARGIQPSATLYHWDLPAALDDRGGWLNPDIGSWFADYAQVVFRALDDRIPMWSTLNEPWVVTDGGYLHGLLAPGHRNHFEAPLATHHLMLAHGAAVEAYRAQGKNRIGIVVNLAPKDPASERQADRGAAKRDDAYMNRQYLDPVFLGSYPPEMREIFDEAWPEFPAADMARIRQPIDFVGVNYYTRNVVRDDPKLRPVRAGYVPQRQHAITETGWEVYPQGLTDILVWVTERYGRIPLYITENGAAFYDPPTPVDGRVADYLRTDYYRTHLRAAHDAMRRGVDLRGYFAWSLLDNFEWSLGYAKRFGIVHVDYATQERTVKESGRFYSEVIRSRGEILGTDRERETE
jgi:beta-glucosidase